MNWGRGDAVRVLDSWSRGDSVDWWLWGLGRFLFCSGGGGGRVVGCIGLCGL